MTVLLHDAAEYVVGDVITPLKAMIGDGYAATEARMRTAIHLRFRLRPEPDRVLGRLIKRADRIAAHLEATRLAGFSVREADEIFGRPEMRPARSDDYLEPWPTDRAQEGFLTRFGELSRAPI